MVSIIMHSDEPSRNTNAPLASNPDQVNASEQHGDRNDQRPRHNKITDFSGKSSNKSGEIEANNKTTKDYKNINNKKRHSKSIFRPKNLVSLATLFTALVGFITAYINIHQLDAMKIQVSEMKKSNTNMVDSAGIAQKANEISLKVLDSAERPWISIKNPLFNGETPSDMVTHIQLKDEGKTPALDVKYKFYTVLKDYLGNKTVLDNSNYKRYGIIFPGSDINPIFQIPNDAMNIINSQARGETLSLKTPRSIVFVFSVSYKDNKGQGHESSTCYAFGVNRTAGNLCTDEKFNIAN